ncbi:hypothetical protein VTK73DRAFT_4467 [Phialemonium thermophilum]|uniref:Uncharacterized protein n=1 Tax=Phialemonium thermophilum TaxID=223376 RepID=A0ABR3V8C9_9PEZI
MVPPRCLADSMDAVPRRLYGCSGGDLGGGTCLQVLMAGQWDALCVVQKDEPGITQGGTYSLMEHSHKFTCCRPRKPHCEASHAEDINRKHITGSTEQGAHAQKHSDTKHYESQVMPWRWMRGMRPVTDCSWERMACSDDAWRSRGPNRNATSSLMSLHSWSRWKNPDDAHRSTAQVPVPTYSQPQPATASYSQLQPVTYGQLQPE